MTAGGWTWGWWVEGRAVVDDILRSQAGTHDGQGAGWVIRRRTSKDVRTSGGTLWPKTRNEEFGRSREIVILPIIIIIIPHFHPGRSPFLPRSHARPFVRVLARVYIDIDNSDHRISVS